MKAIKVSALRVGKCYLTNTGRVWRVRQIMPDGRVLYEHRADNLAAATWAPGMLMGSTLPAEVEIVRAVPCEWMSGADEA